MLVKPHSLFREALSGGWALGAFNTSNLEVVQAIVWAAEAKASPVIVQTSEGAIEYAGLKQIVGIVQSLADEASVPVVLHLDHGKSMEIIQECIEAGYGSVMIDASSKVFAKNVALTKQAVEYAHERGVWVEAELGAILGAEGAVELQGGKTPEATLTEPSQAGEFVEATGVDALAVAVGTIHGAFTGQEYIRFELLQEIESVLQNMPLVLHGASGIADKHIEEAATTHVAKINVDTEIRIVFEEAVSAYLSEQHDKIDPRKMLAPAREAVQRAVEKKLELFGAAGKASV